jgi:polyhydroxyalkanoate synthesis regulator protein
MPTARRNSTKPASAPGAVPPSDLRVLKKYPNRRLYDTQTSSYITLSDVKQMVLEGQPFEVREAKDGSDLTRAILLQIIRFYGHTMQGAMGTWFEQNMKAFADVQGRVLGGNAPVPNVMGSYFEQSQKLFKQMQDQAGTLFPGLVPPKK